MKKETEKQIKDAILELSKRIISLEDELRLNRELGKLTMPTQIQLEAIINPDGTYTPIQRLREIIIS